MSEEIASADALLTENAELRAALQNAWVLIGRIDMALETLPKRPSLRTIQLTVTQLRREIKKASESHGN